MELEKTDQEQVEQLQNWWRENRVPLLGGLILGIGALVGWERWQGHSDADAQAAAEQYAAVSRAVQRDDAAAAGAALAALREQHAGSIYVAHGLASLAALAAEQNDWSGAVDYLRQALDTGPEPELSAILRVRLARAQWANGDAAAALSTLGAQFPQGFDAPVQELRGDIAHAQGDRDAAREAWEQALQSYAGTPAAAAVNRKLARLGASS